MHLFFRFVRRGEAQQQQHAFGPLQASQAQPVGSGRAASWAPHSQGAGVLEKSKHTDVVVLEPQSVFFL